MGVKVQYNPSTGKVSYNPATGKVQVVVSAGGPGADCNRCITEGFAFTPKFVSVTFSEIEPIVADTCYDCPFTLDTYWYDSIDPNQEFILEQTASCVWEKIIDVDLRRIRYTSTDGSCSGNILYDDTYTKMRISLDITLGDSLLLFETYENFGFQEEGEYFRAEHIPDFVEDCVSGSVSNSVVDRLGCGPVKFSRMGINGIATVVEIP